MNEYEEVKSLTSMEYIREWFAKNPGFHFTEDVLFGLLGIPMEECDESRKVKISRALYYLENRGEIEGRGTSYTKRWRNVRIRVPL